LIIDLCEDLFDEGTVKEIWQTGTHRVEDGAKCREMGRRFTAWLANHKEGLALDPPDQPEKQQRVGHEKLMEWVRFLNDSGGYIPTREGLGVLFRRDQD
jgi:hypothetical protein